MIEKLSRESRALVNHSHMHVVLPEGGGGGGGINNTIVLYTMFTLYICHVYINTHAYEVYLENIYMYILYIIYINMFNI